MLMKSAMKHERKIFNTTLRTDLIRKLKILAAENDSRLNVLLEAAIEDFLQKHSPRDKKTRKQKGEGN